ncbi:inhibitor of apoptosis 5 [Phthorimaea operculella granulovirus]|uniref:Inhibitor of apoptosis 5 n=1 Tax=Phthorimaea operculella granulovirus TaxID=192584 RepID=Q8JRV1_9BBAC|nr:inhibitor of apoptosis 5 [Phthorimaea operculella granulovirus]AAM70306.1 inhibitor of apoptosis 5 [Phthorimaea operculella granulovirus]ANY57497.1 inhibitor of apoptosis 5 [Phthorimaea operculella granulovirus]QBH65943.1 inhibitor of apoptosis 5 [Phthorimaea operculella granulovirus]QBH66073.1 inhibitor of apoptosis 5 [Phthorimaea operculella granulovirus]QBH66203.1 inhibitor of apoptosis 5 [Phthorimaea operculella granulovirus]
MNSYENRLKTFENWTGKEDAEKLALVGFYYSGFGDRIICYYCKLDLYNFFVGDEDSIKDHKRYSPNCPFFLAKTINYVNTNFLSPRVITSNYTMLAPHKGDYTLLEHRIDSFQNYPQCLKSLVVQLCEAGFYYTNVGDAVCCYVCKIIAKNWTEKSNAWQVHKKLNEKCPLVELKNIRNKYDGDDEVANKKSPSAPPFETYHFRMPKCLKCRKNTVDCVLVPCFHLCICKECAFTCTQCVACDMFCGSFFVIHVPFDKLALVENSEYINRG